MRRKFESVHVDHNTKNIIHQAFHVMLSQLPNIGAFLSFSGCHEVEDQHEGIRNCICLSVNLVIFPIVEIRWDNLKIL